MKPIPANAKSRRMLVVIAATILAISWVASLRASTAIFVATTGSDTNDCLTLATACQHISAALGKASVGDIIIVADGTFTENLTLDKNITLVGYGQNVTTISGGDSGRVMTVTAAANADVSNVSIVHGSALDAGGILISGTLRLSRVTLSSHFENAIYNAGILTGTTLVIDQGSYVGIVNHGAATIISTTIQGNHSGIWNYGTMRVSASTIMSNTIDAYPGAGIANFGTMVIDRTQVRANTVNYADGGGIYNEGVLTVTNSLVVSNTAYTTGFSPSDVPLMPPPAIGGGIYNAFIPPGRLDVNTTTIAGNRATSGKDQLVTGGYASLTNVTLSGDSGRGGLLLGGMITMTNVTISEMPSSFFVTPSVFARNTIVAAPCDGNITSLGHNLDSGNTCGFTATGDLTNTNPLLGPLQDNGGPTPTYAIPANSPAVNAGDNVGCPATDQRGVARPQAGRCDIGAYEYVFPVGIYLPFVAR